METINFSDFMNNNYKPQYTPKKIYSISPLAMIDPNVALIAGGVIAIAAFQTILEQRGDYEKSEKVSSVLGFSIPCVALVFILKLLNVVSGVFL